MTYNPSSGGGSASWSSIAGKPSQFPPEAHTQAISTVTGLQSALDGKQAAGSYQPLATVLTNTTAAFTTAQQTKLAGVATGATANSSDATLLARANHTGTQAASTISDFNSASRAQVEAELIAGTNITITPSGTGATRQLTIAASGGGGGSDPWTFVFLSSDSAVSTTAFGNTGNLSFAATAGSIYAVEVFGVFQSAATTTGSSMALDVPAGSSVIGYYQAPNSTTTSQTTLQIAGATTTAVTASSATANTNLPFYFMGTVSAAINGTVQVMHRSEVAASAITVKAGLTHMRYRKIN